MLQLRQTRSVFARVNASSSRVRMFSLVAAAGAALTCSVASAAFPLSYTYQLQLRGNLSVNPGGSFNVPHGTTLNSTTVVMNNSGAIATKLSSIGTTSNQGIWYGPGNGTGGIVATGPDSGTALWSDVALSDTGRIVVPIEGSGLNYRDTANPPGVTFLTNPGATSFTGTRVNSTNQVGYRAGINGNTIFRYNPATNTNIPYASQTGNNYSFIFTPWLNNNNQFVSHVTNTGAGTANDDQVRKFNADGSNSLVVQEGQVIPGWGTVGTVIQNASMNDAGEVAIVLRNTSNVSTLFKISADGSTFTQIATASTSNPTGGVRSFPAFTPIINNNGLVAFRAQDVNASDPTSHDVIMVGDGTNLLTVIAERGSVMTDLGAAQIGQETLTSPAFAGNIAFNDSNQVAFTAGVYPQGDDQTEWGTAIFIANAVVPEPATIGLACGAIAIATMRRRKR